MILVLSWTLLSLHLTVCLALFWTNWLRILKMDRRTLPWLRASVVMLAVAAIANAFAPFVPQWQMSVSWPQLLMEASILGVQAITTKLWKGGTPRQFQGPPLPKAAHHA